MSVRKKILEQASRYDKLASAAAERFAERGMSHDRDEMWAKRSKRDATVQVIELLDAEEAVVLTKEELQAVMRAAWKAGHEAYRDGDYDHFLQTFVAGDKNPYE